MNVSDYIIDFLVKKNVSEIFTVSGGGSYPLSVAMARRKEKGDFRYICNHHEQASAMAVEAYARVKGFGAAVVTSGPGVTNLLTGVVGAYLDSTPCMFISGQTATTYLMQNFRKKGIKLRNSGVQEIDPIPIFKSITKYARRIMDKDEINYELEKAYHIATTGRPGPVLLDIPQDIQAMKLDDENLRSRSYIASKIKNDNLLEKKVLETINLIKNSKRPILYLGQGVKLSHSEKNVDRLLEKLKIPVITSWNAADVISDDNSLYVGRAGMFGQRAANFAITNSDLFLSVGARLSVSQTGYKFDAFAREAKKIIVDIDRNELNKYEERGIKTDILIKSDAKDFLSSVLNNIDDEINLEWNEWLEKCHEWKEKFPNVTNEMRNQEKYANSYHFIDKLSDLLPEDAIVVTDMGTSFTGTYQSIKVKKGQKINTSSGIAAMGFGLPGAIGACIASGGKKTFCITGEGGLMMNLQELQTIKHHNLPIKIFVINNNQYHTIVSAHDRKKDPYCGCDNYSGISFPNMMGIWNFFNIFSCRLHNNKDVNDKLEGIVRADGNILCDVLMDPKQSLEPRMVSKEKDGKRFATPLEDMEPFLSDEELRNNMIIAPYDYK